MAKLFVLLGVCLAVSAGCMSQGAGEPNESPSVSLSSPGESSPGEASEGPTSSPSVVSSTASEKVGGKSTLGPNDPVPEFSGPWAGAFERAYRESTSQAQRDVLEDGRFTEQEMSHLQDLFKECLEARGYSDIVFNEDGTMEVGEPAGYSEERATNDYVDCQTKTIGTLDLIYQQVRRNPDAVDEQQAMADCLVRQDLVEPGYSGADYTRDTPDRYPFDPDSKLFLECVEDPLNAGK